jgi:hypothetical protein
MFSRISSAPKDLGCIFKFKDTRRITERFKKNKEL